MAKSSANQTIMRHWKLLSRLPCRAPGITASDLHAYLRNEGYEITKRQVERDLPDLVEVLNIQCNDKGKPYGWYWPTEMRQALLGLNKTSENTQDIFARQLHPHDFSVRVDALSSGFVGRHWLFELVINWFNKSNASILCMVGVAGVGKSAFAARLLKRVDVNVVGHYFCRYQSNLAGEVVARDFIQTLAYQLVCKYPAYRNYVAGLLSNPQSVQPDVPALQLFESLITKPLQQIEAPPEHAVIVIDALDEAATNSENHNALFDLLVSVANSWPSWLRIVITSRPTYSSQQYFSSFDTLMIDPASEKHLSDIRNCITTRLESNLQPAWIEDVIEKSNGSFLYVNAIVRAHRQGSLNLQTLPTSIDDFILASFKRLFPDEARYSALQAPLLGIAAAFPDTLPKNLAADVLGIPQDECMARLQAMLGNLLIQVDGGYQPFHRSLFDWLTDRERSGPYAVPADGQNKIADYLAREMMSLSWPDFSASQQQFILAHLPGMMKSTPHWNNAELLTVLASRLHKSYQYHAEAPIIQRLQVLADRATVDRTLQIKVACLYAANERSLGSLENALAELNRARAMADANLPHPHICRIEVYRQLGITAHTSEKFDEAGNWFIRAIEESKAANEAELALAKLYNNAGRMWMHLPEHRQEAEGFLMQSLEIRTRDLGKNHPETGRTLNNLGYLCMLDDRLNEAEKHFQQALKVKQTRSTGYEHSIALAQANLGSVYLRMGLAEKAEQHLLIALEKREEMHGKHSVSVANTLKKLGNARLALCRYEEALEDFQRSVECYKTSLPYPHLSTLKAMVCLQQTQQKIGQHITAQTTANEILHATSMLGERGDAVRQEVENVDMN